MVDVGSSDSTLTPSKRKLAFVPIPSKKPLTERQATPRSETLHSMYNSMAQIDKLQEPRVFVLKKKLEGVVENVNELDGMDIGELVEIQADLVSILSIITRKLMK